MKAQSRRRDKRSNNRWVFAAPSAIHGRGLFARREIPPGMDFVEYDGPRLPLRDARRIALEGNSYIFEFDRRTAIDGSVAWNLARHANHGCSPNSFSAKADGRIWLRALRTIAKGEEITYDYGYRAQNHEELPCRCGQPGCRGKLG